LPARARVIWFLLQFRALCYFFLHIYYNHALVRSVALLYLKARCKMITPDYNESNKGLKRSSPLLKWISKPNNEIVEDSLIDFDSKFKIAVGFARHYKHNTDSIENQQSLDQFITDNNFHNSSEHSKFTINLFNHINKQRQLQAKLTEIASYLNLDPPRNGPVFDIERMYRMLNNTALEEGYKEFLLTIMDNTFDPNSNEKKVH